MQKFFPIWFAFGFSVSYPLFLMLEWHPLLYYPLTGEWSVSPLPDSNGPAMQWYGLIVAAGLAGAVFGLFASFVSTPLSCSRWAAASAVASMGFCAYLLRGFF